MNYFFSVGLIAYAWIMPLHLAQMNQLETNSGEIKDPVPRSETDKLPVKLVTFLGFTDGFVIKLVLKYINQFRTDDNFFRLRPNGMGCFQRGAFIVTRSDKTYLLHFSSLIFGPLNRK